MDTTTEGRLRYWQHVLGMWGELRETMVVSIGERTERMSAAEFAQFWAFGFITEQWETVVPGMGHLVYRMKE